MFQSGFWLLTVLLLERNTCLCLQWELEVSKSNISKISNNYDFKEFFLLRLIFKKKVYAYSAYYIILSVVQSNVQYRQCSVTIKIKLYYQHLYWVKVLNVMGTCDIAAKASIYIMFSVVIAMFFSLTYYFSQWSKCQHGLELPLFLAYFS